MSENGIASTNDVQTRHHEYAGRYEFIRKMLERPDSNATMMWGQCALIMCDILEETRLMRQEIIDTREMLTHPVITDQMIERAYRAVGGESWGDRCRMQAALESAWGNLK